MEVFHRTIDDTVFTMSNAWDLWANAATIIERERWQDGNRHTWYTTWNGRGIKGPNRNKFLKEYPTLKLIIPYGEFKERFAYLPSDKRLYMYRTRR